ncbi:hypothetical protein EYZ11_010971 [Aspergillus tanneri]|uniref:Uncharacterized protein n=1 Tax=Aspergillus tanneri TaxID=1220188 RepID=A0A4S3J660_9EURO|nr:uncharacterized protein ATNIH1004_003702 [Aspergillus tanneri]KAA8651011.1 hypothetical protein ATNIH1004_003702 [Aspergillus tanneri]THC89577.1 hypothetical protein EYZ11_010971 [Aspergillus tanneri]
MWPSLVTAVVVAAAAFQPLTSASPLNNDAILRRDTYQPKTVNVTMKGLYKYSLLQEVHNPNNTDASFERTIDTSYEITRSTFLEHTSSETKTESHTTNVGFEAGASYGIVEAKVSASSETSSQLETAFSSLQRISTEETIKETKSTKQSFTIGKGDTYTIYERIFTAPGINVHTNAVVAGPNKPKETEIEYTVTLQENRFLKDIKVQYGDNEFSEPQDAIKLVGNAKADVNKGFGGKYVWLVPVWTNKVSEACSNVGIVIQKDVVEGHDDLAAGAGGKFRFLFPQVQDNNSNKITDIQLYRSSDGLTADALSKMGFQGMSDDINKGRKGDYLYLLWKTVDVDHTTVRL